MYITMIGKQLGGDIREYQPTDFGSAQGPSSVARGYNLASRYAWGYHAATDITPQCSPAH